MNPSDAGSGCVFVVDDDPDIRDALDFLLSSRGLAVRTFAAAAELLQWLDAQSAAPQGVFLLDIRMSPMNGNELHEALLQRGLRNPVLFLTGHGDIPMAVAALQRGAFDFMEKPCSDNALVDKLIRALRVDAARHATDAQAAERSARFASLTEREREVMPLVARGLLNKQIADALHVSVRTVEVHRARVFGKLGLHSAAELATLLSQHNAADAA
ncbi:response regulator transcription factor [Roseateles sp. BYS180W]|uniref:Response regulator transcription factor n=1 Tax=Roseateles rivi TaxID=3299028 RepID=A0ABW7FWX2_9BURK